MLSEDEVRDREGPRRREKEESRVGRRSWVEEERRREGERVEFSASALGKGELAPSFPFDSNNDLVTFSSLLNPYSSRLRTSRLKSTSEMQFGDTRESSLSSPSSREVNKRDRAELPSLSDSLFSIPALGEGSTDPILSNSPILSTAFTKQHASKPPPWATSLLQPTTQDELEEQVEDETSSAASTSASEPGARWEEPEHAVQKVSTRVFNLYEVLNSDNIQGSRELTLPSCSSPILFDPSSPPSSPGTLLPPPQPQPSRPNDNPSLGSIQDQRSFAFPSLVLRSLSSQAPLPFLESSARLPPPSPSPLPLSLLSSFKSPWDPLVLDPFSGTRRRSDSSGSERSGISVNRRRRGELRLFRSLLTLS